MMNPINANCRCFFIPKPFNTCPRNASLYPREFSRGRYNPRQVLSSGGICQRSANDFRDSTLACSTHLSNSARTSSRDSACDGSAFYRPRANFLRRSKTHTTCPCSMFAASRKGVFLAGSNRVHDRVKPGERPFADTDGFRYSYMSSSYATRMRLRTNGWNWMPSDRLTSLLPSRYPCKVSFHFYRH